VCSFYALESIKFQGRKIVVKKETYQREKPSFLSRTVKALSVFLTSVIFLAGSGLASQFEIPDLVAPGSYQFELGTTIQLETDTPNSTTTWSLPSPAFITGVADNLEIEAAWDGMIITDPDGAGSTEDLSDFSLFAKFGITSENGLIPNTAGRLGISLPTGAANVTSDGFDPSFTIIASWGVGTLGLPLPKESTLYLNFDFAGPTNGESDSKRYLQYSTVVTLAFPITGNLSGFAEYFNSVSTRNIADTHSLDAGLGYQFTKQFYTELTFEHGILNDAAPNVGTNLLFVWTF
jgi:hypothetical protein